jgi:hypothetical protein
MQPIMEVLLRDRAARFVQVAAGVIPAVAAPRLAKKALNAGNRNGNGYDSGRARQANQ